MNFDALNDSAVSSGSSIVKGILRKKAAAQNNSHVKVEKTTAVETPSEAMQMDHIVPQLEPVEAKPKKTVLHKVQPSTSSKQFRQRTTIKVKKSTKDMLANMNKKDRKAFIRGLAEKNKKNFALSREVVGIWEKLRSSKCRGEEMEILIKKLINLLKGHAAELIYAHDTSRVFQYLLALKRENIRNDLFEELTPEIVRMAKSKYSKFFVNKMLKYGSKQQRDTVVNAFRGHCVKLFKMVASAPLLDTMYSEYSTSEQRQAIVSEFYGPEYVLFRSEGENTETLKDIAANKPEKIPIIMQNLETVLETATQKLTLKLSLTHKLMFDYLTYCTKDQKKSLVDTLRTNIPEMIHTRDGSRTALLLIWNADESERKDIVKSFHNLAVKAANDEFGRRALFGIFDVVDNTKLVNKYILKEIADNIADVVYDKFGVWVLHYLVHPRQFQVFGKGLLEILRQGDSNEYSEKTKSERYTELFNYIKEPLYTFLAANMREVITNKTSSVLILDALEPSQPGDPFHREVDIERKKECFMAIAEIVGDEFVPHDMEGPPHIVQAGCQRFVFRKLLQSDAKQQDLKLSDFIVKLPKDHLQTFVGVNSGCFALLEMMRSGSKKAKAVIEGCISLAALKNSSLIGAKLLHDELVRG
ncbi:CPL domain-containing protein [Ditylenchus destructor]|uniref:CPL domain-containing protein n=1 Tax=Ditylenchus destructor TaxID=166010 RepID=A0AAD4MS71_9BILA|nr:CPL domain-containing protein [Ditylenchus destructor]